MFFIYGHSRGHGRNSQYHAYDNTPSNSQERKTSFHHEKRERFEEKDEENIIVNPPRLRKRLVTDVE